VETCRIEWRGPWPETREAPLTHEIALAARQMPLQQDPADRILAATAQILDLTLVSSDERLLGLGIVRTFANR
jgi:PIN domain nuclease of toxin-antitoxin system